MKKVSAILLAFLLLAVAAKDLVMLASYSLNRDFIANAFCINRDKPELHCNGKCYLEKKISEGKEKEEGNAPVAQPEEQKQAVYFQAIEEVEITGDMLTHRCAIFAHTSLLGQLFHSYIFHPPRTMLL